MKSRNSLIFIVRLPPIPLPSAMQKPITTSLYFHFWQFTDFSTLINRLSFSPYGNAVLHVHYTKSTVYTDKRLACLSTAH